MQDVYYTSVRISTLDEAPMAYHFNTSSVALYPSATIDLSVFI